MEPIFSYSRRAPKSKFPAKSPENREGVDNAMAKKKVADLLVDVLAEAGVRQIYGVSGDSLNGITDSIRGGERLRWIHVRHEETAAFAAGAEAHLTGRLAGCAGSFAARVTYI
jgi:TPP-dependent 2-oxoacid decarboxylase